MNAVAPGAIETDFGGGAVRDNPQINAFIAAQTAQCRAGVPDDIGGFIAALLWTTTLDQRAAHRGVGRYVSFEKFKRGSGTVCRRPKPHVVKSYL